MRKSDPGCANFFLPGSESFGWAETSCCQVRQPERITPCRQSSFATASNRKKSRRISNSSNRSSTSWRAKSPKDVRYLVLKLSDGTFCHLVEDETRTISTLDAFAAFRHGGSDRRVDQPQQLEATIVGNYRMLADA
jgi:hypothetical protein